MKINLTVDEIKTEIREYLFTQTRIDEEYPIICPTTIGGLVDGIVHALRMKEEQKPEFEIKHISDPTQTHRYDTYARGADYTQ